MLIASEKTKFACGVCGGVSLSSYSVDGSRRGNRVGVCQSCGSIELFPSNDYDPTLDSHSLKYKSSRHISPSEGALWGNIRHGKGLRLTHTKKLIEEFIVNHHEIRTIYDDGSNRGAFSDWVHSIFPHIVIEGCEPDRMIWDQCSKFVQSISVCSYLEDVKFQDSTYDLIYSAHTLEHVDNVVEHISVLKSIMHENSFLIIDLPNSDQMLAEKVCLEEYFVEKHRTNFFSDQFKLLLESWGFIVDKSERDDYNFVYICRLGDRDMNNCKKNNIDFTDVVKSSNAALESYLNAQNLSKVVLNTAVQRLNEYGSSGRYIVWGGGRLLGTLLDFGLDTDKIEYIIDNHLYDKIPNFRGLELNNSDCLNSIDGAKVFVNARSSTTQIIKELVRLNITEYITLTELVAT